MNLKEYASFLKKSHLNDLALENLALALKKQIPVIQTFSSLPYEQMLGFSEKGLREQLESFIDGTALNKALQVLEELKTNQYPGAELTKLKIDDFIYLYSCQKQAFINYLPYFEKDMSRAVSILYELETYYSEVQKAAFQTLSTIHTRALAENERNYRFLAENASDIIFRLDPEGNIIYISSAVERLLGYSPSELQLTRLSALYYPEDKKEIERELSKLSKETSVTFTYRLCDKTGSYSWFETVAKCLYDNKGMLSEIHGSSRDVTLRKENEERIQKSENMLNETQHIAHIGSWEWDFTRNTLNWSDEHYRLYGFEPGMDLVYDIVRKTAVMGEAGIREKVLKESVEQKKKCDFVHCILVNDQPRYMHVIAEPVLNEKGEVILLRGTSQDVTVQKQTERELEKTNTELMQFASVASHDLKEPLRKILTFSSLLEAQALNPKGQDQYYLEKISESAQRMQNLINDLLSFSRLNNPSREFHKTDLNLVIGEILQDLEIAITEKKAEIKIDKLPSLSVNPGQIRQVFQNLISNSLKFTPKDRKPFITVSSKVDNGNCNIFIKDNGIGFDEKYLDKIFTIFQRLHPRDEYEGTGIGLAICRKVMENHKGSITASSIPDKGATFILTLPLT